MEALLLGLSNLLDTHVIIAILIGAIGGVVIGAIPGIGPAIAIAILLPATIFLGEDLFLRVEIALITTVFITTSILCFFLTKSYKTQKVNPT